MKNFLCGAVFILSASVSFYSQNVCNAEEKGKARAVAQKLEADNILRLAVENGYFGDCVHYSWMDEMRKLGIKQVSATIAFVWNDKIERLEIRENSFLDTYYRYNTKIKNKDVLAQIESSGLKKQLEEELLERARKHVLFLIESLKEKYRNGTLKKEPKGKITGTLYHNLLDDETLPGLLEMPTVEF